LCSAFIYLVSLPPWVNSVFDQAMNPGTSPGAKDD
jgi:hypothetical protein